MLISKNNQNYVAKHNSTEMAEQCKSKTFWELYKIK